MARALSSTAHVAGVTAHSLRCIQGCLSCMYPCMYPSIVMKYQIPALSKIMKCAVWTSKLRSGGGR